MYQAVVTRRIKMMYR